MRLILTLSLLFAGAAVRAQSPAAPATITFEVASVKPNKSSETRIRFETPPGRLTAVNVPLRFMIRQAYRVPESRILGGPKWIDVDRFDVVATTPALGSTSDRTRQMLIALLADRFQLIAHMETREMAVYALGLVRSNGALGPNLRRSAADCSGGPRAAAGRVQCGLMVSQAASASLRGGGTVFADFVRMLGDFLDRPVIDQTALTGAFDLELQFTADRGAVPGAGVPGGLTTAANPDLIPSIFTALREQLGLKLEAQRGKVEVLVVDSVSQPTDD